MIVELEFAERMNLGSFMPAKGSYIEDVLIKEVRDKIDPTPEEMQSCNLRPMQNGTVTWQQDETPAPLKVELSDAAAALVKKTLTDMDTGHNLPVEAMSLYDKFVGK